MPAERLGGGMGRGFVSAAIVACVLMRVADSWATVYTWIEDGARHFTNSAGEVPEQHRATAKSFVTTSQDAETPRPDTAPSAASMPVRDAEIVDAAPAALEAAYGRGVERGAAIARAQTRVVGELAGSLVEATLRSERAPSPPAPPPSPPAERVRSSEKRRPAFRVSIVPAGYRWPGAVGYGSVGAVAGCPGCCCASGLGYGFGFGRLVPHSHFFPSLAGARRAPLFFPNGHQLDANLFLVGRGYWVD